MLRPVNAIRHRRSVNLKSQIHFNYIRLQSTVAHKKYPVCILGGGPVGLFLSSQLSSYGIEHCIVERREVPTKHPQAHFMNARTMEILQAHLPNSFKSVLSQMPPSKNWRDFVYCHSVGGRSFARVDHFSETSPYFWDESPSNITHLPQNKLEIILREEVFNKKSCPPALYFGYEAESITDKSTDNLIVIKKSGSSKTNSAILNAEKISIRCDYLIAADGANSLARRTLNIPLKGEDSMHTLMNIHFTCRGLSDLLKPRPAMLYFVFNQALVAVFVAHDTENDEWVCQIPIFPPFRNPEDFDNETIQRLLKQGLGLSMTAKDGLQHKAADHNIDILSVNSWTMHAQVAESFANSHNNVFLVGDAAHRFPPAGGFGMNTGLQDAHNIAWKIAVVAEGKALKGLLTTYESVKIDITISANLFALYQSHILCLERKPIALANTALSMRNYEKSASVARMLGVDPALAKIAINTAKSSFSSLLPLAMRKIAINGILDAGLSTLALLSKPGYILGDVRVRLVQRMVNRKESLPLLFPKEDIDFDYRASIPSNYDAKSFNEASFTRPLLRVGGRVPHCWLLLAPTPSYPRSFLLSGAVSADTPEAPGQSGISSKYFALSSVSLCGLSHPHTTEDSKATSSLPKILVMVDESHYDMWMKAISGSPPEESVFMVVAVKKCRASVEEGESSTASQAHHQAQNILQQPRYVIEGTDEMCVDEKNDSRRAATDVYLSSVVKKEVSAKTAVADRMLVHDFTGRWMEICSTSGVSESADALYSSVVLRPDGHIAAIFKPEECTNIDDIARNLAMLKKEMQLL